MKLNYDQTRLISPHYNDTHESWRHQLRRFVDQKVIPFVDEWEEQAYIPDSLWLDAADIGLLQMGFPESLGGVSDGIDVFHSIIAAEELSRCGAGGVHASLMVHNIGLPPVVNFASQAIKQTVVPEVLSGRSHISLAITEPSGGSDVARLRTTATRDGDYYVVNGSKTLITGGIRAKYFTTAVRTGDEGLNGISLLLIAADTSGVTRTKLDKKQGWWCSDTASIFFDQVKVPVSNLIGSENAGFLPIMQNFNSERLGMTAGALSCARVCIEEAAQWACERQTFGKPLLKHQVIRHKFAEMVRKVNATQAYMDTCAWQVSQQQAKPADLALLKVQATLTMEFCAREALQILGGAGYLRGSRSERIYREVRVNAIGGGSEEIMRDLAAKQLGL